MPDPLVGARGAQPILEHSNIAHLISSSGSKPHRLKNFCDRNGGKKSYGCQSDWKAKRLSNKAQLEALENPSKVENRQENGGDSFSAP
eukprot:2391159-Amphidinium_carterae.2